MTRLHFSYSTYIDTLTRMRFLPPPRPSPRARVDKNSGQVCYVLLDAGGLPLPHFQGGHFPGANPAQPMAPMAPMATTLMGAMPMGMPPAVAPVCPPAAATPIAIVGDRVKPDKWEEHTDKDGNKCVHRFSPPPHSSHLFHSGDVSSRLIIFTSMFVFLGFSYS